MLDAGPDVLNHNTETVPRLYRLARAGGRYPRTLDLLDRARDRARDSHQDRLMVGLGESGTTWTRCRPSTGSGVGS